MVFNANLTDLAAVEEDVYRAEGIQYIIDNLDTVFGR